MVYPNQLIELLISKKSMVEYYLNKHYNINKIGQKITVKAEDISTGSKIKIKYICDYCGEIFERSIQSNSRSKKNGNEKDACLKCSRTKRTKETSLIKYGVDNPMKVEEIQRKCEESKNLQNFTNSTFISATGFVNGIPVSAAQYNLFECLLEFTLNYHYKKYYIDLFFNNVAIEYDGRGHDLGVRMGKISQEDFIKKEKEKTDILLENFRLLRIIDKKDKMKNKDLCEQYFNEIYGFINGKEKYRELIIS